MAFIHQIEVEQADGLLKKIYDDAITRVGRVWNIVKLTGINPRATRAHLGLYASLMQRDSSLSQKMRETLAVVVSKANDCFY